MTTTIGLQNDESGNVKLRAVDSAFAVFADYTLLLRDETDMDVDVDLRVQYSDSEHHSVVTALTVRMRKNGPSVTSTLLRTIPVLDLLRRQRPLVVVKMDWLENSEGTPDEKPVAGELSKFVGLARDHDTWERNKFLWVKRTWAYATTVNLDPAKEVASLLGLSARTATRWIAAAHELYPAPDDGDLAKIQDAFAFKAVAGGEAIDGFAGGTSRQILVKNRSHDDEGGPADG
jgi:hypothetical protein